jgi:uncharacterized membrane protein
MAEQTLVVPRFRMGAVLGGSLRPIWQTPLVFGPIVLLYGLIAAAGTAVQPLSPGSPAMMVALSTALSFVVSPILQTASMQAAMVRLRGTQPGLGACLVRGLRLWWPVLVVDIGVAFGVGLGLILLIVPGMLWALRWSVAVPVAVAEAPGISAALARSAALTRGHRWAILGVHVVIFLLGLLVSAVAMGAAALLRLPAVALIAQQVASVPLTVVLATLQAATYLELRRLKEGLPEQTLAAVFA